MSKFLMTSDQSKKIRVCRHFGAIFVKSTGKVSPSQAVALSLSLSLSPFPFPLFLSPPLSLSPSLSLSHFGPIFLSLSLGLLQAAESRKIREIQEISLSSFSLS
jgi:hypothetical protein